MAIGNSNSIPFKNRKGFSLHCLTNALLFTKNVENSVYTNIIDGESDALIKSNAIYLDGVTPSFVEFPNDLLLYAGLEIIILHSADNVTWTESTFFITETSNLFSRDTVNRKLYIGYIAQYYSVIKLKYDFDNRIIWKVLNASNFIEDDNIVDNIEMIRQVPSGIISSNIILQPNLIL